MDRALARAGFARPIAAVPPVRAERAIGWSTHYFDRRGVRAVAAGFLGPGLDSAPDASAGTDRRHRHRRRALFIMQPAMGMRPSASRPRWTA